MYVAKGSTRATITVYLIMNFRYPIGLGTVQKFFEFICSLSGTDIDSKVYSMANVPSKGVWNKMT